LGDDFTVSTKSKDPKRNDRSSNVSWDEEEKTGSSFLTESNAGISKDHHDLAVAVETIAQATKKTAYLWLWMEVITGFS